MTTHEDNKLVNDYTWGQQAHDSSTLSLFHSLPETKNNNNNIYIKQKPEQQVTRSSTGNIYIKQKLKQQVTRTQKLQGRET